MKPKILGVGDGNYISPSNLSAMEKAFTKKPIKGSDVLNMGAKSIIGNEIDPEMYYIESPYAWVNGRMPLDIIIQYPNGAKHTLTPHKQSNIRENVTHLNEREFKMLIENCVRKVLGEINAYK
jgi:hypothetical protein